MIRKELCFLILPFLVHSYSSEGQAIIMNPDIQHEQLMEVQPMAVRIAKCDGDGHLYYISFNGDVYRIDQEPGLPATDALIATEADHGINYLQGLAISDSTIYLSGNYKEAGVPGHGIVARGQLQVNGTWLWSNLMTTEPYASSAHLFDHAFSGLCLNPAKDSIIVCSGSRTDHGEVQVSGGMFPGYREVPLTSSIFRLPVTANNLILQNDSAWLSASGYVYARGFRNAFDVAYDKNGNLFAVENSGDRDDPDELNWIQQGHHYGFPWVMGGNFTGQQSLSYDPTTDLLINHGCLAWQNNFFYNDPGYPQMPPGLVITQGLRNSGPDADTWRSPATGNVIDVSSTPGYQIRTFTSHKSPLGLVFDQTDALGGNYTGDGFVLGYTMGCSDSSGYVSGYGLAPALDVGEDLLQLKFTFDPLFSDYIISTTRIASGFKSPVDAALVGNVLYVIENGYPGGPNIPKIWKLTFPDNATGIETINKSKRTIFPVPSNGIVNVEGGSAGDVVIISDITGKVLHKYTADSSLLQMNLSHLADGYYLVNVFNSDQKIYNGKIIIAGNK
jgi:hypothetical protein